MVDAEVKALLFDTASALALAGASASTLFSYADRVPRSLVSALSELTRAPKSDSGYCVLKGILADFPDPGPTPPSWSAADQERTREFDIAFALVSGMFGKPFGWQAQQGGNLVHNIVPSRDQANMQVGASSTVRLEWHTEDSYHPDRPELLLLACVRNPDEVGTDIASVRQAELSEADIGLLSEVPVLIQPDDSYAGSWSEGQGDTAKMVALWRTEDGLCMRFDPPYTRLPNDNPEFREAWQRLGEALDRCGTSVVAEPGDVVVVNNDVAAHARRPFHARYDGTDRWLKRILVRGEWQRPEAERGERGYGQVQVGPHPSLQTGR
ncbi:TauD/TfdA family dioxygenase [Saccharopolyspora shandongensis]|uniref:TauD/TfdA family dioxygenase n=1 Tax=Saccharopolyspora shandongensis TaxID=418495 RepID=UPI003429F1FE